MREPRAKDWADEAIESPPAVYIPPPLDLLPSHLREFIHAAAESLNVDNSFILLPLISATGSAIGNTRSVVLKRHFIQPPVIWTSIIGRTGSRKSPALAAGCAAVMEHEKELVRENKTALEIFEEELATWEQTKKNQRGPKPQAPTRLTCLVDDLTMASLAEKLESNPHGLLVCKDELAHWFAAMDQYHDAKGTDVNRWLSLHTGVFLAVDRKTRGESSRLWVPRVCIAGGIQPSILARVLTENFFERGLPARFLFAAPPGRRDQWTDNVISEKLSDAMLKSFSALYELQPDDKDGVKQPKLLRLDPDAQAIFVRYYNACGDAAIEGDERIEAAWSKLSGYAARLALVGQLAHDPKAESVTGEVMQAACDLARWFGDETIRIYATMTETVEQRDQRRFVEFIASRGGSVTVREVTQSFRPMKNQRDKTEAALSGLVSAGRGNWGPLSTTDKGGRPTRKFQLIPLSTSTKPLHLRGKPEGFVDVDTPNIQKIAGNSERDLDAVPAVIADEGPDESWTYD